MNFKLWLENDKEARLRQLVPNFPDYVFKDLLFGPYNKSDWQENYLINIFPKLYGIPANQVKWRLEKVFVHPKVLEPNSRQMLEERLAGAQHDVANDAERTTWQKQAVEKEGISNKPLIMVKKSDGYELLEGWHRVLGTMSLEKYKNGYTAPVWLFEART